MAGASRIPEKEAAKMAQAVFDSSTEFYKYSRNSALQNEIYKYFMGGTQPIFDVARKIRRKTAYSHYNEFEEAIKRTIGKLIKEDKISEFPSNEELEDIVQRGFRIYGKS